MQPQNGQLSPGFIKVEDAINLIKQDTRDNATLDLDWMTKNIHYINENKNFRIPLMKSDANKIAHHDGSTYVYIKDSYEKEMLRHAIRTAFRERTGRDINPEGTTHNKTTVYDPEHNTLSQGGAIQTNPNPTTKLGDNLGNGEA